MSNISTKAPIITSAGKAWKPMLYPNNKVGKIINWEERLSDLENWVGSVKLDGARVELQYLSKPIGRSLKEIKNVHIHNMCMEFFDKVGEYDGILEGEFYSPNMNFAEIMHFFRSEDVTSAKSKAKYKRLWERTEGGTLAFINKVAYPVEDLSIEQLDSAVKWDFPGRDAEWLTSWHDDLKIHVFDHYEADNITKFERIESYESLIAGANCPHFVTVEKIMFDNIDAFYQAYDQAIMDGAEGLIVTHGNSMYKSGRCTEKERMAFKIKDDKIEFDGLIVGLLEETKAREGSQRTINELGRSQTSRLKEDRVPSGICKGFEVLMDDGRKLTVSLTGFSVPDKVIMLREPLKWIGETIKFTGMEPVKIGGVPRQARFKKGDIRDGK